MKDPVVEVDEPDGATEICIPGHEGLFEAENFFTAGNAKIDLLTQHFKRNFLRAVEHPAPERFLSWKFIHPQYMDSHMIHSIGGIEKAELDLWTIAYLIKICDPHLQLNGWRNSFFIRSAITNTLEKIDLRIFSGLWSVGQVDREEIIPQEGRSIVFCNS